MNGIYDPGLVVLSVLVATFASYTALDLARSVARAGGIARARWLAGGSLSMGVGIWSMHFIGMLAVTLPWTSIAYDIPLLTVSILVALVASAIALELVGRQPVDLPILIAGGIALAAAISGMHYIGMAAMRMEGAIEWDWVLVAISIIIALVASFVALRLAFGMSRAEGGGARHIAGAIIMGIAISGMHYTGMAAARFTPSPGGMAVGQEDVLATDGLAFAVTGTTGVILITALVGSIVTRELARRTALAEENARLYRMARREMEERKEVERTVRAQSAAMEAAVDGMSIIDSRSTYTYVNAAHAQMYGYLDRSDLIGRDWTLLYDDDERRRLEAEALPAVARDGFWRGEAVGMRADGSTFPQDVALTALEDGGLICVVRDITERKEAERAREVQQRQLSESDRLRSVGELAAGVAHEVNNPLQAISGCVELLLENEGMAEEVKDELALIGSETKRAGTIIRNLLAFARPRTPEKSAVDPVELVRSVLKLKERHLRLTNVEINFDPDPDIPFAWADPHQIQQVIHNLLRNSRQAIQHVYPQGTIRIIIRSSGDMLELIVEDTGPGLQDEVLEKMFTPFFTTKETGEGTGLGLSISREIVVEHGGSLSAENWGRPAIHGGAAGEGGARFVVRLPLAPAHVDSTAATDRGRAPRAPTKPHLSRRLLMIEDEPAVASVVERFLTRVGHEVEVCLRAEHAIEVLQNGKPFDAILSDLKMPGVGGRGLYHWLEKARPDLIIRLIFTSGDVVTPETHTFLKETGRPILPKPYELSDLRAELDKLFD